MAERRARRDPEKRWWAKLRRKSRKEYVRIKGDARRWEALGRPDLFPSWSWEYEELRQRLPHVFGYPIPRVLIKRRYPWLFKKEFSGG